ncbi:MAG: arsenate reductase [Woeseiaceae bacterium]|jgi:arsenate reductase|tara:strand:- start:317 stop:670 length:354 start_codon:yes stop_codon:yes gene_type:complete
MELTIYHNPQCSKSRNTLSLIKKQGIKPEIILYLENIISAEDIRNIAKLLHFPIKDIIRNNDKDYLKETNYPVGEKDIELSIWLAKNPEALQRPIVLNNSNGKAIIGRPPENLYEIL